MGWVIWQYQDEFASALLLVAFVFAMLRGAAAERAVALALFCELPMVIIGQLVLGPRNPRTSYQQFEPAMLVIDLVSLALFLAIALRANRVYPLWIAGAQLIAVMAHFVRLASDDLVPRAYASLVMAPLHLQIVVLLAGVIAHLRREARFGPYPAWRESGPLHTLAPVPSPEHYALPRAGVQS